MAPGRSGCRVRRGRPHAPPRPRPVNIPLSLAIVVAASALAVGALLLLRRRSPHGGHFGDTGRATGVFGILATSFAVLFAFVVFFAFRATTPPAAARRPRPTSPLNSSRPPSSSRRRPLPSSRPCCAATPDRSSARSGRPWHEARPSGSTTGTPTCSSASRVCTPPTRTRPTRTPSGSTSAPSARRPGACGRSARRASSPPRCGSSC